MSLANQIIVVTGSTTGIGEAIARRAASQGARVMIHGTRERAARDVAESIRAANGEADYVVASLQEADAPARIIQQTIERWGGIDALINNAALTIRCDLEQADLEIFERTMAINVRAPLFLIREALPYFRQQGGGRVMNIGSINAYCGERPLLIYSMSKGAMMTMTRNLADAHGAEGLRVNQINVGWTLTPNEYALKRKEGLPENWHLQLPVSNAPSGRIFSPEEVAETVLYFLSSGAALINGAVLDLEQFPVIGRNPEK